MGLAPEVARRSGLDNLGERARRHGGSCLVRLNSPGCESSGESDTSVATGTTLLWQVPLAP